MDAGTCLGSVFFLGYIPGCYGFALLADKFGRRPVLLLAIFGNTVCLILFGFSLNPGLPVGHLEELYL